MNSKSHDDQGKGNPRKEVRKKPKKKEEKVERKMEEKVERVFVGEKKGGQRIVGECFDIVNSSK